MNCCRLLEGSSRWQVNTYMEIPYKELSSDTLQAVIEEFITREGTDYGEQEYSLQQKIDQVKAQLKQGEIIINYDVESQSCHIQAKAA